MIEKLLQRTYPCGLEKHVIVIAIVLMDEFMGSGFVVWLYSYVGEKWLMSEF
jgi:hypothetical protein